MLPLELKHSKDSRDPAGTEAIKIPDKSWFTAIQLPVLSFDLEFQNEGC